MPDAGIVKLDVTVQPPDYKNPAGSRNIRTITDSGFAIDVKDCLKQRRKQETDDAALQRHLSSITTTEK